MMLKKYSALVVIAFFVIVFAFFDDSDRVEEERPDFHYKITQEDELRKKYFSLIKPHSEASKLKYFKVSDKIQLAYKYFKVENEKATIVILSGRTEGLIKYEELIYDLNKNGFSVYIYDHRGQGFSSRMTEDSQLGYVKDFFDYVEDMKAFVDAVVKHDKKLFLLAHSMGGAIASLYLETYPKDFDVAVLSSPMHQPALLTSSATDFVCRVIKKRIPKHPTYIMGENSYDNIDFSFKYNLLTHSKMRYELSNIIYEFYPKAKIGGPSVNWVSEACRISDEMIDDADSIKIPVLLLQAGGDTIVNLEPQKEFCQNVGENCQLIEVDDAYHELFIEKDIYRNEALNEALYFFNQNL